LDGAAVLADHRAALLAGDLDAALAQPHHPDAGGETLGLVEQEDLAPVPEDGRIDDAGLREPLATAYDVPRLGGARLARTGQGAAVDRVVGAGRGARDGGADAASALAETRDPGGVVHHPAALAEAHDLRRPDRLVAGPGRRPAEPGSDGAPGA